jgi:hypothetical protein
MAERLGRHAILFHARCRASLPSIQEAVVHDHFETFVGRQDRALGIGTAVGSQSWFVYDIDPAPHRGSGRRPDRTTPAMRVGLTRSRWRWERLLSRRLFPARERLKDTAALIYGKQWTKGLPKLARKHAA